MPSASSSENYVTAGRLRGTATAMIVLTSLFCLARFFARWYKTWRLQAEDLFMLLAFAFFLAMSISSVVVIPAMYRVTAVERGKSPPYATLMDDALMMIKIFFCNSLLLFLTLWSVKFSLLFLYRRLMTGLPKQMRWWWGILVFSILTLIGAIVSNFTSCSSMHAWFTPGLCSTPRDARAQIASLYYAFATDVLSDIMIMVLPIGLIWNVQMPRSQKLGIGAIFCLGIVCIITAIIRVVQIGVKSGNNSTPSSSWLALWGIVETGIAVIIGCLPSFAVIYRNTRKSRRGYSKGAYYEDRITHASKMRQEGVMLSNMTSSSQNRPMHSRSIWGACEYSSSQEQLAKPGKIAVTSTVRVSSEVGPVV